MNEHVEGAWGGRVRATATVEDITPDKRMAQGLFCVTVTGLAPHAETRVYPISAPDDNSAAMQGIERFVSEVSPLPDLEG